jgi:hypothetical protein
MWTIKRMSGAFLGHNEAAGYRRKLDWGIFYRRGRSSARERFRHQNLQGLGTTRRVQLARGIGAPGSGSDFSPRVASRARAQARNSSLAD